jgi:hypothetical protein
MMGCIAEPCPDVNTGNWRILDCGLLNRPAWLARKVVAELREAAKGNGGKLEP